MSFVPFLFISTLILAVSNCQFWQQQFQFQQQPPQQQPPPPQERRWPCITYGPYDMFPSSESFVERGLVV